MWRAAASSLLLQRRPSPAAAAASCTLRNLCQFSQLTPQPRPSQVEFTPAEAQRIVRLVGVELLKRRLRDSPDEVVGHGEFLDACMEAGAAGTRGQTEELARAMDQSGSVVLFRGKVYLHPEKVVDLVRSAVPPVLEIENGARKEFELLKKKKEEIDMQAHKQVKWILWSGLLFLQTTVGLFFRLTFWEFSWEILAPVIFFVTSSDLLVGYAYFLVTLRKLSYRSYMERLFETRRKKLCAKHGFDMEKYLEMERNIRCPLGGDCSEGCKLHESWRLIISCYQSDLSRNQETDTGRAGRDGQPWRAPKHVAGERPQAHGGGGTRAEDGRDELGAACLGQDLLQHLII